MCSTGSARPTVDRPVHMAASDSACSIVRHLVEAHGGMVRAESAGEGRGATFVVSLPAQPPEDCQRSQPAEPVIRTVAVAGPLDVADPISLCGVCVLVVDDENDAREMTTAVLARYGVNVASAASAREALNTLSGLCSSSTSPCPRSTGTHFCSRFGVRPTVRPSQRSRSLPRAGG